METAQKRDRARRAAETSEQRSEKAKGGRTRHAVQTVSETKATLQRKSTCECGAETPEERETWNGISVIQHLEGGDHVTE